MMDCTLEATKGQESNGKGKSRSKSRSRKVTCWHCKKDDHLRQNWPKWKGNKKINDETAGTAGVVTRSSNEKRQQRPSNN